MRRRVTRRHTRFQAVWYPDNIFTNFERHWSTLNIEADDNLFGGLRVNVKVNQVQKNNNEKLGCNSELINHTVGLPGKTQPWSNTQYDLLKSNNKIHIVGRGDRWLLYAARSYCRKLVTGLSAILSCCFKQPAVLTFLSFIYTLNNFKNAHIWN